MTHIPTTILAGYLGAGKTTLINHLLAGDHGRRIAVLVNDFGAVNVDAALIENADDQTISLTNGCVCCSITDDLGTALAEQTSRADPPEHIVIEASGVAEPARMALYADGWLGVALDAVVTMVDAESIRTRAADRFVGSVVKRQIAAADILLLNKVDLVPDADAVRDWLQQVQPDVTAVPCVEGKVAFELLLGRVQHTSDRTAPPDLHLHFSTAVWTSEEAVDLTELEAVLSDLPESIHRVKGFVVTPEPVLVQKVGDRLSVTSAQSSERGLVLIGTSDTDIAAALVRLDALTRSA